MILLTWDDSIFHRKIKWFTIDCDIPVVQYYTDEDILELQARIIKTRMAVKIQMRMNLQKKLHRMNAFFTSRSYVSEQQLMSLYLLKKQLEVEKAKKTVQTRITDVFKSLSSPVTIKKLRDEETASPSGTATATLYNNISDNDQ
ncbi:hypothetical protein PR048_016306 [Dryococelus australis]|uniref:Uncharacterized protein n=1 Tax=Dryococelus australis TaxID=614101 RepID=A0ABQ9HJC8_9NEOP|nr:hypothetical protein PR048_016306 [Dryococelus australis]